METSLKKDDIRVFPDHEAASRNAVSLFLKTAQDAIAVQGTFSVALSGGSTPMRMLGSLGSDHAGSAPWDQVQIFWADERCVPQDSTDSNFGSAYELLLSLAPLPEGNIHRIRGEDDPVKEAARYERELRSVFPSSGLPAFDLIILGIGIDGHTASLFPDADSLHEAEKLVIPVYGGPYRGWRITLTLPIINNAKNIVFLATGSEKAGIVARILTDEDERSNYPAGLIDPAQGKIIWLLDEGSAKKLGVAGG